MWGPGLYSMRRKQGLKLFPGALLPEGPLSPAVIWWGKADGIKAHLECKGLILKDGLMHAIPELRGYLPGVEMSHEAAVGKIDQREIEYLMARGLDEEAAVSTIVRGFLNVNIEGLPQGLAASLDKAIAESQKDIAVSHDHQRRQFL